MTTNTPTPTLPSNVEELRAEFEAWVKRERKLEPDSYQIERAGDGYYYDWTDAAWDGWKAARASTSTDKEAGDRDLIAQVLEQWKYHKIATKIRSGMYSSSWPEDLINPGVLWDAISRARSASVTDALQKLPVAFRVRDNEEEGCEWAIFLEEENAAKHAERHSVEYQGLYVRDGSPTPPAHGEGELRSLLERVSRPYGPMDVARNHAQDAQTEKLFYELADDIRNALSPAPSPPQQDGSGLVENVDIWMCGFRVSEFVTEYEFRGDQDHYPTDFEALLIEDAINGALGDLFERHKKALASTPKASEGE
jgi:hypothetical protein